MRKFLILATLLFTTPAAANTVTAQRVHEISNMAPTVCRIASTSSSGTTADNVMRLVPNYTPAEMVVMLAMCKQYLHGRIDAMDSIV